MPTINFTQFDPLTSANINTDHIVGYYNIPGTSQITEGRWKLNEFATTILPSAGLTAGSHQIKKFPENLQNGYYQGAAITKNEEVIAWGYNDGSASWGHGVGGTSAEPYKPVIIPFIDGTRESSITNRYKIIDVKSLGLTIVQLYYSYYSASVLLSNGTVWVRSYLSTSYPHGFGQTAVQGLARYSSAFYQVDPFDFYETTGKIVKIKASPLNGVNSHSSYLCLDSSGDLHAFGYFNPKFGSVESIYTPLNITKNFTFLAQKVKSFQMSGNNGQHVIQVILTNGEMYAFGYNGNGQLGNDTTTNSNDWVRCANTSSNIADAEILVRNEGYNHVNLGYISKIDANGSNKISFSGYRENTYGILGLGDTANKFNFKFTSTANNPITEAVIQGRTTYSTCLFRTLSGEVYSSGVSSWGEGGRLNGASVHLGPTLQQVSMVNPVDNASGRFGPTTIRAIKIIPSFENNAGTTAIIGKRVSDDFNYVFFAGYQTLSNISNGWPSSSPQFIAVPIKESVEEVILSGDRANHQFAFVRCVNGRVYGFGYSAYSAVQGTRDGWVPLPLALY